VLPAGLHAIGSILAIKDLSARLSGFLILAAVLVFGGLRFWLGWEAQKALDSGDGPNPEAKVNCPGCGARTTAESPECDYCGSRLADVVEGSDG